MCKFFIEIFVLQKLLEKCKLPGIAHIARLTANKSKGQHECLVPGVGVYPLISERLLQLFQPVLCLVNNLLWRMSFNAVFVYVMTLQNLNFRLSLNFTPRLKYCSLTHFSLTAAKPSKVIQTKSNIETKSNIQPDQLLDLIWHRSTKKPMLELHQVKCKQALTRTLKAQQNTDLLHVYYYIKKTPQLYREVLADCILSSLPVFLIVISLYPTLMPQEIFFFQNLFSFCYRHFIFF